MIDILKNCKIRFFLAFFSLFILFDMVQDSYAKYVSSASASSNFTIARWAFKVNDVDVLSNNDFTNEIVPVLTGNDYVEEGYIAPNSEGYFDIEIDSSNVDVSFQETITLSLDDTNTVTDLTITGYKLNDGTLTSLTNNTITTIHELNEENTTNVYRVYVKWLEGLGETMNNSTDTAASSTGVAAIKVSINFLQTTQS